MRQIFLLSAISLTFLVNVANASAQAPAVKPSPTPQAPNETPGSFRIVDITLADDGFKAAFPGVALRNSSMFKMGFGDTEVVIWTSEDKTDLYRLTFFDFPTAERSRNEVRERCDLLRNSYASQDGSALVSLKDIVHQGYFGREFIFETRTDTRFVKCVFAKQRLVELFVQRPGVYSDMPENAQAALQKPAQDFFAGVSVTKLPPPKYTPVALPADFGLSTQGQRVTSRFFGLSFDMPKGWVIISDEASKALIDRETAAARAQLPNQAPAVLESRNNSAQFLLIKPSLKDDVHATLRFVAEKMVVPNYSAEELIKNITRNFLAPGESVTKEVSPIMLGGKEFFWVEITNTDAKFRKRLFAGSAKNVSLQMLIVAFSDAEMQAMMDSLQSMKFDDLK